MIFRFRRYSRIYLNRPHEVKTVPIAGDAAIATVGTGHGRLIPLLILDTTERPDLAEVIQVQAHFPLGEVTVQWGALPKRDAHIALLLQFQRPTEGAAIIEFDIEKHGILVEHILTSNALYIQAGKPGDRLMHDLNLPKMIIEVPDTDFRRRWDKLYLEHTTKRITKNGLPRKEAKQAAHRHIESIRGLAQFKMK
jgi:hypothetical protein